MSSRSISKRTFLKSIGLLAILGVIAPWLRRSKVNDYPMEVQKDPNAIPRGQI